jgi:hypothetical protein
VPATISIPSISARTPWPSAGHNDIRGAEQPGVFLRVASLASDLTCPVDMFKQLRLALKALG